MNTSSEIYASPISSIITKGDPASVQKALHFASVSVPLNIPTTPTQHPGECTRIDVPFGPPVIHAEPEKTQPTEEIYRGQTSTQFIPSSSASAAFMDDCYYNYYNHYDHHHNNPHNKWFFKTDKESIYLSSFNDNDEETQHGLYDVQKYEEDEDMEGLE